MVICIVGQTSKTKPASPNDEVFEKVDALAGPYRLTGCGPYAVQPSSCTNIVFDDSVINQRFYIYNENGDEWFSFRLNAGPENLQFHSRAGFVPFARIPEEGPYVIILRMTGESKSWYAVEVNEDTREIKYISKQDRAWAKTPWELWLNKGINLKIDGSVTKLLDKPNGTPIKESEQLNVTTVRFLKADGDWVFVQTLEFDKYYRGWIRWRDGRRILVGSMFNNDKVPS